MRFCAVGMEKAYAQHAANKHATSDYLIAIPFHGEQYQTMKKKTPYFYAGEIRKTINMPPALWLQIEARMNAYEPPFAVCGLGQANLSG
jgi:hypothetical protein